MVIYIHLFKYNKKVKSQSFIQMYIQNIDHLFQNLKLCLKMQCKRIMLENIMKILYKKFTIKEVVESEVKIHVQSKFIHQMMKNKKLEVEQMDLSYEI